MTYELSPHVESQLRSALELILSLAGGDLTARGFVSDQGDDADALIGGLNMLAEELEITFGALQRRTIELEHAHEELMAAQSQLVQSARLASLGEIAAGIAHELNQPLGIIQLYCESAVETLGATDESTAVARMVTATDQVGVALGQVDRASEIVRQVRTFARDDTNLEMAEANVEQMVWTGLFLLRREMAELDIELVERIEPGLRPLRCREHRVQQILFNLVANARDAVRTRGGARVELEVGSSGSDLVFEVSDNGPGVDPDDLTRFMDPFFTTKPAGLGTGLGLAICQTIATEHGGSLTYSRRDDTTVFALRLPHAGAAR